jgi:hypothetical protein
MGWESFALLPLGDGRPLYKNGHAHLQYLCSESWV